MIAGLGEAFAQTAAPGVVKGFNFTRYFPAPNHQQMEMKLTGAEAVQLSAPAKRYQITQPKFLAFRTNGEVQMVIEAPECLFEEPSRTVSSPGHLAVQTGDGRFRIAGDGFLWRQNGKTLVISNNVRAVIEHLTNNAMPLEITSRWFEMDADRRRAVFHDNVRGEDTNQVFTCGLLAVSAGTNKKEFDLIEAEQGLEIAGKLPGRHATAQRGIYRRAEERVDLIGEAAWEFDGRSGRAERMTAWQAEENFEAVGKVVLGMPREALGAAGGLLNPTNAPVKATGTNIVQVFTEHFTKRGNLVLAEGAVRVTDGTNQLSCDRLEGRQATRQSPDDTATATGHVFVERGGGGIHSARADYSKTAGQIVFTGDPRFEQEQIHGTAGRVMVRTLTSEVLAEDNVAVTFPLAAGGGTFLDFLPNAEPNRVVETNRPAQTVGIAAHTFRVQGRQAVFAGDVQAHQLPADGSEPRLRCGELEVRIAPDGRRAESLQARQEVVCERGTPGVTNGPAEYARMDSTTLTAHANPATGDLVELVAGGGVRFQQTGSEARSTQAVYTRADEVLKLIGHPTITRPEGTYSSDRELTWDNARRIVVGSDYKITVNPETLKRAEELEKLP